MYHTHKLEFKRLPHSKTKHVLVSSMYMYLFVVYGINTSLCALGYIQWALLWSVLIKYSRPIACGSDGISNVLRSHKVDVS